MVADHEQKLKNATALLGELRRQYGAEIFEKGLFILVAGSKVDEASEAIGAAINLPTFRAELTFQRIFDSINKQNYVGKTMNSNLVQMINNSLIDIATDNNVREMNLLVFKNSMHRTIKDEKEFYEIIKKILTSEQVGAEIIAVQAARGMVDYGIEEGFDGDMMPIVITSEDLSLFNMVKHLNKLGKGAFTIHVGEEPVTGFEPTVSLKTVSKTSITNAFKQIKKQINNKKGNK